METREQILEKAREGNFGSTMFDTACRDVRTRCFSIVAGNKEDRIVGNSRSSLK